jgi:hypothetical protein
MLICVYLIKSTSRQAILAYMQGKPLHAFDPSGVWSELASETSTTALLLGITKRVLSGCPKRLVRIKGSINIVT